ncbi:MAG: nuclear transport factor 2 family protein [Acidimicrobiales bacterium]|nr:nuclear transport factor 2 family protein [Hyphomonadaceae bacterium]RZV40987.1 MAG: nuclear transport factor 2 family protein [Acidimicrobiales bacterium]
MSDEQVAKIEKFIHDQVAAWNARDKDAFFKLYKAACPGNMTIEYVGRPIETDSWAVLDNMWETSNALVDIDIVKTVVNANEAVCYHINRMPSRGLDIHTMELYRFDGDDMHVKYLIKPEPVA